MSLNLRESLDLMWYSEIDLSSGNIKQSFLTDEVKRLELANGMNFLDDSLGWYG